VDAWETTYLHVLHGQNPVLEWVKGTALRPVLAALEAKDQAAFLEDYGSRLLEAYPVTPNGTILPFRRVFFVAERLGEVSSLTT
jgi:trans-aconitate 2-methyltransferase